MTHPLIFYKLHNILSFLPFLFVSAPVIFFLSVFIPIKVIYNQKESNTRLTVIKNSKFLSLHFLTPFSNFQVTVWYYMLQFFSVLGLIYPLPTMEDKDSILFSVSVNLSPPCTHNTHFPTSPPPKIITSVLVRGVFRAEIIKAQEIETML